MEREGFQTRRFPVMNSTRNIGKKLLRIFLLLLFGLGSGEISLRQKKETKWSDTKI